MTRFTMAQLRKTIGLPKPSKYHNKKTEVEGHLFDSKKEVAEYKDLLLLQRGGLVETIELQPEFVLQDGYRDAQGKWVRPIVYRADFRVKYADGREVVIDTKGCRTQVYAMKKKMLLRRYPELNFVEK